MEIYEKNILDFNYFYDNYRNIQKLDIIIIYILFNKISLFYINEK